MLVRSNANIPAVIDCLLKDGGFNYGKLPSNLETMFQVGTVLTNFVEMANKAFFQLVWFSAYKKELNNTTRRFKTYKGYLRIKRSGDSGEQDWGQLMKEDKLRVHLIIGRENYIIQGLRCRIYFSFVSLIYLYLSFYSELHLRWQRVNMFFLKKNKPTKKLR